MDERKNEDTNIRNEHNIDYNLEGGKAISNAQPGEEVVISGISGSFPGSANILEFEENLYGKVNMMTTEKRFNFNHPEIPPYLGIMPIIDQYDAGFFGVHDRQAQSMDPVCSIFQEKALEAIFDAGLHPSDLQNTRTGIFVGSCYSENEKLWFYENLLPNYNAITGSLRSIIAHRLHYFLKLKGPSFNCDTACSSSLYALEHAYRAIRMGEIDNAIVGGGNLCLHPMLILQFARLGVLSMDNVCKPFDMSSNGYVRSEAIGALILQKASDAKRIYGEVVYVKSNCDGHKEQGITFPSKDVQKKLFSEFYNECGVDRYSLSFMEAHGTGTIVGDPEECSAVDDIFTKEKSTQFLMGSVKSSIGHSEASSGICSIIKCIIGMENGFMPPNISYTSPRPEILGLVEGRMKVITENTKLDEKGLVGVNSFGFGGANCHVLLHWNTKTKPNRDSYKENLPRLVCVSGRTEEAVISLLDSIVENKFDAEHVKLVQDGFRKNVSNHLYRGYTLGSSFGEIVKSSRFLKHFVENSPPLYFIFGEMSNWYNIGCDLMALPSFYNFILQIQKVLLQQGINIVDVFQKKSTNKNIDSILGSVIVGMGLVQIFNLLEIKPSTQFGHASEELVCAYWEGSISLEETISYAFSLGKAISSILDTYNNNQKKNSTTKGNNSVNGSSDNTLNDFHDFNHLKTSLKTKEITLIKDSLLRSLSKMVPKNHINSKAMKRFINAIFEPNDKYKNFHENMTLLKIGNVSLKDEEMIVVSLFDGDNDSHVVEFLKGLGRLYELGYNPQISQLYPPVELPVSRGTKMISPYIRWNHRKPKTVPKYYLEEPSETGYCDMLVNINVEDPKWAYIAGHVVNDRILFPAVGYLYTVFETFAAFRNLSTDLTNVRFENCRFIRATTFPKKGNFTLHIGIQTGSGNFEVVEGTSLVATGRLYIFREDTDPMSISTHNSIQDTTTPKLKHKEVYKEMKLRGYNYSKDFRLIQECDVATRSALIKWENNWVTFIDNMLQLSHLPSDTRLLHVPIFLSNLTIRPKVHLDLISKHTTEENDAVILPVQNDPDTGVTSCGGITASGLIAGSIRKKKIVNEPVLESYKFVPNITELNIQQSVRVNTQIILENSLMNKVKAVELIDEFSSDDAIPLVHIMKSVLDDLPLIEASLKILSKISLENSSAEVENNDLSNETDCLLVIATNILDRPEILEKAYSVLAENGFIISRENINKDFDTFKDLAPNFSLLTMHQIDSEVLLLFSKKSKSKKTCYIKISSSQDFNWLSKVQDAIKKKSYEDIVLYAANEPKSGILGLVNCLRREPGSKYVRCMFMMEKTEEFEPQNPFYSNQLSKQMAINIYKNGQWGTYRHLLLDKVDYIESEHCFANLTRIGDLSSLKWMEGPLNHDVKSEPGKELIYVYYCALNFRDIMTATGKINSDIITKDRIMQESVQGFEFSGRDKKGNRYMGITVCGALSTLVMQDVYLKFPIPDDMSMEEAATIPIVYGTVICGLIMRGRMRRGESILIHSGTGGIGQAAIRLALHYGCKVFTTVGTQEKRDFLKQTFPQLGDNNIGNSHDDSFEQLVLTGTEGRGVDLVLNSLAEEKLMTSVRCLAPGGRFIEIGKFDLANNTQINMLLFKKEASFHGVMWDQMYDRLSDLREIFSIMNECLKCGVIKPLNRTVFQYEDVEKAFRYMATGKHMGKVLVQIREPEQELVVPPSIVKFSGISRFCCNLDKVYIIIGGLGGFGLELADWLVLRGARKIVLTSRKGVTKGYQACRIRLWKSYGVFVKISIVPTTRDGYKQLLEESLQLGSIAAIFNLAVVLADAIFEDQTPDTFTTSFKPKAYCTEYLDELSRQMCPELGQFVVFSSVSCGRGNVGQTNYGMSNSVMERICEDRKSAEYPALAIEWGAIGDVGLVAEMLEEDIEIEIGGTLQQRISSCVQVLDTLLNQREATIVSSMVVAEKRVSHDTDNVIDSVLNILGVTDSKSVSFHSTLSEMGMDSMTGVEIRQVLERNFELTLSAKELSTMTLAKLNEMQEKTMVGDAMQATEVKFTIELLFRLIGSKAQKYTPQIVMESKVSRNDKSPTLLLFPGIEGLVNVLEGLTENLSAHTVALQYNFENTQQKVIEIAKSLLPIVEEHFPEKVFNLISYSYGCVIALEVVHLLESRGYSGTLICIDGAPLLLKKLFTNLSSEGENIFQTNILSYMMSHYVSSEQIDKYKDAILNCKTWEERVKIGREAVKDQNAHDVEYLTLLANSIYMRLKAIDSYIPSYSKLKTNVKLIRPTEAVLTGLPEDYGLSEYFEKPVEIYSFKGNHSIILENESVTDLINSCFGATNTHTN